MICWKLHRAIALGLLLVGTASGLTGRDVLSKLQKRYKKLKSFSAEFTYTFRWKLVGEERQERGRLFFRKPNLFRVEAPDRVVVCDGRTVWNYTPSAGQALVTDYGDRNLSPTLRDLLSDYLKSYTPYYIRPDSVLGRRCYLIKLAPKDSSGGTELFLWVEGRGWMLRKLSYSDEVGNETTYLVREFEVNPKLDRKVFEFEVPEGVEVVDLRLPNSAEPNTDVNGKLCVRNNGAVDATDVEIPIKAWVNGKRDEFYDITWTVDRVNAGETVCTDIYVTVGGKGSYKFCADSKCVVVSVDKHGPIWPFDIDVFKNIPKEIAIPVAVGVGLASVVGLAVIVSKK